MKFQSLLFNTKPRKQAPTLNAFVDQHYRSSFLPALKPTTQIKNEGYLKLYILRFMGDKRMDEITVTTVQQFMNWMAEGSKHGMKKDINAKTIKDVCGLAGRIYRIARDMKIVDDVPFSSTLLKNPGKPGRHHKALPDEEITRVRNGIAALENPKERLYMALLAYTGMRREELCGLRWEDLNLSENCAKINIAVTYPGNKKAVIGEPKTERSARTVLLVPPLVEILTPLRKERGFILGGENPIPYSTVIRLKKKAFEHLSIVGYGNHDFRTTYGTQLKESGMSSAIVADVMGHADTRMVETVYARTRHEGVMKQLAMVRSVVAG